ncbi:MAG: SDR family NAD(P)-dependent oxidoreductase, partial [Gemmatimonadaceae bacterium]|nr:SDR family NAD(P)-dependent oxidoreductase [Gemmatimonadaceae bacterium]
PLPAGFACVITDDERGVAACLATHIAREGGKAILIRGRHSSTASGETGYSADLSHLDSVESELSRIRDDCGRIGALIHLAPLREEEGASLPNAAEWRSRTATEVKGLFNLMKAAGGDVRQSSGRRYTGLLAAASMGGGWALGSDTPDSPDSNFFPAHGGIAGIVKTAAQEWPEVACRVVDMDLRDSPDELASRLFAELCTPDSCVQVGYRNGRRVSVRPATSSIPRSSAPDAAQLKSGMPVLGPDSVVMATGGARGITAEIAIDVAARSPGSTWVLLGRSPSPAETEPAETRALETIEAVRAHFVSAARTDGSKFSVTAVESKVRRLIQEREIRRNLTRFVAASAMVRYVQADVGDSAAVAAAIADVRREFGRLDGVIHGAGTIDDRLIESKSPESFDSVFDPKVDAAVSLAHALDDSPPSFLVFFSSTAAAFGNKGQCDYAAANEVLNKLAEFLVRRWKRRVVAIGWGPWDGAGMVSPELRKSLIAAGTPMIDVAHGVTAFTRELESGSIGSSQVIYTGELAT